MRVGVEVGGTFTDLVAVEGGRIVVTKVPSTPRSPDIGAFAALTASGIDLSRIKDLGHGSTVATNAVLERKGAAVAFIATAGFRDLLFMTVTARGRLALPAKEVAGHTGGIAGIERGLHWGHDLIVGAFDRLASEEAKQVWGRHDD